MVTLIAHNWARRGRTPGRVPGQTVHVKELNDHCKVSARPACGARGPVYCLLRRDQTDDADDVGRSIWCNGSQAKTVQFMWDLASEYHGCFLLLLAFGFVDSHCPLLQIPINTVNTDQC